MTVVIAPTPQKNGLRHSRRLRRASRYQQRPICDNIPRQKELPVMKRASGTSNDKRKRAAHKRQTSAGGAAREVIRKEMKKSKEAARVPVKFSANGAAKRNGAIKPIFQHPKTALEAAIQRYVDLFDFAPVGYVSFNRVGHIEEINLAAAQLLGGSRDRLIGGPFALHVTKEDSVLFLNHLLRCRSSESRVETDLHLKKRNGEIILAHLASSPMTSSMRDGVLLYQTAIIDLTERKLAEEAIRQSEKRYRTLFDLVPVAVYTCDAEGLIQEYNQHAVELWGRAPKRNDPSEKFCGSFKIFYPDGRPMPHHKCPMARALRGEKLRTTDLEILVEQSTGARRSVLVSPTALRNGLGKIIGAINCLHDITVRKRTENALRESEERSRAVIHQSTAGIAGTDLTARIIFANEKFCSMLGYKERELVGKTIFEITHPSDMTESRRLFRRIVTKAEPYQLEKRYRRKDGSTLWVSVSASPLRDAEGKTQSAVSVIIDISDRKKAQAILEDRARGLEGEILAISDREQRRLGQELHDSLCQHLTAIAFMARSVALRLEKHRVIEVEDIQKIAELINDGVTEARTIARGLHPVEMEPPGLVTALATLVKQPHWPVRCRLEADEEISVQDSTVALHLYRIAREAIINANKYARAREIVVRMRRSTKGIELSVIDDGVGIPANSSAGSGMGFHIMQYRARSVGARLEIKAIKPHGTRVTCYVRK
jgi:PAS domain S-box-containing protein